jgi:hypothetical protein
VMLSCEGEDGVEGLGLHCRELWAVLVACWPFDGLEGTGVKVQNNVVVVVEEQGT